MGLYKIYAYVNKYNNCMYIGTTKRTLVQRAGRNGKLYKECTRFYNAICKYGFDAFIPMIIENGLTREQASEREAYYVELFNTRDPEFGYNTCKGGFSLPGEDNPFYKHTHTEKTKDIIRESNKRRVWTEEQRQSVKIKNSRSNSASAKAVRCIETGEIFLSMVEAAEAIHVTRNKITDVIKGRLKSVHGFHFELC